MSFWGKIGGAAAGLLVGGPAGGILGLMAGHFAVDVWLDDDRPSEKELAFTVGVIALGAKMAKADGVVVEDEIRAFREVFKVPSDDLHNVARIFDMARKDVAGFESYAKQLADLMKDDKPILEDVIDGLFHIAKADNILHPKEIAFLEAVSQIFGFSEAAFEQIKARHVRDIESDPYHVLGIGRDAKDEDIKSHYRKLVKDNHPDILMGRGVPEAFLAIASERLKAINEAYEVIARERGL